MEEPVALSDFPAFIQSQAGPCASGLRFEFVGSAKEVAEKVMIKTNFNQVTPHVQLTGILREAGLTAQVGDSAIDGTIVISASPAFEGETTVDPPTIIEGTTATSGIRALWTVGPGIVSNISRSQDFSTGQQSTALASSTTRPISRETNAEDVVQPGSAPQDNIAGQQQPSGTRGPSNPGSDKTGTDTEDGDAAKRRAAIAKQLQTSCSLQMLYLPRFAAGPRPRDFIAIPSLKSGAGRYVEDYEITAISYTLDRNGGVMLDITGKRPFTGEDNMLDESSVSKVRAVADANATLEDWAAWAWNQSSVGNAPALAG